MDPRLALIDKPPHDPDPPRDPLLTAAVMARVRVLAAPRPAARLPAWAWAAAALAALVLAAPWDGGVGAWSDRIDPGLLAEVLTAMAVAGLAAIAMLRRPA